MERSGGKTRQTHKGLREIQHYLPLPPCEEGTFTANILLLAGRGSLVRTFPATDTGLPLIWKVWPEVVIDVADETSVFEATKHNASDSYGLTG